MLSKDQVPLSSYWIKHTLSRSIGHSCAPVWVRSMPNVRDDLLAPDICPSQLICSCCRDAQVRVLVPGNSLLPLLSSCLVGAEGSYAKDTAIISSVIRNISDQGYDGQLNALWLHDSPKCLYAVVECKVVAISHCLVHVLGFFCIYVHLPHHLHPLILCDDLCCSSAGPPHHAHHASNTKTVFVQAINYIHPQPCLKITSGHTKLLFVVSVPGILHGILDTWYEAPIARQGHCLHVALHMHHLSQGSQIGSHVAINACDGSADFDLASCSQLQILDKVMGLELCFDSIVVTKIH